MKKLNERINVAALCFAVAFFVVLLVRFRRLETADIVFYALAVLGLAGMCIAPLLADKKNQ